MDEAPDCYRCHATMSLNDGCEWPDDETLVLCAACAVGEIERLRGAITAALGHVDYLRDVWGDEAITRNVADTLRAALSPAPPEAP